MARSYESIVLARIKALFARKPKPDKADFDAEIATAIRAAGGYAKAEHQREAQATADAPALADSLSPEAVAELRAWLDSLEDDETGDEDPETELADVALIYQTPGASGSMGNGKAPPPFVQKMPTNQRHRWVDIFNGSYTSCKEKGGTDKECETSAFKQANGVVKATDVQLRAGNVLIDFPGVDHARLRRFAEMNAVVALTTETDEVAGIVSLSDRSEVGAGA